jgi:hypothetical protein
MFFNCPICGTADEGGLFSGDKVTCPRCGAYHVSDDVAEVLKAKLNGDERNIANASSWVREHQNVLITSDIADQLNKLPTPSYEERKRKLLMFLQKESKTLGQFVKLDQNTMYELMAYTWSANQEVGFLLDALAEESLVSKRAGSSFRLTAKAYDYLAQLEVNPVSHLGFCAMWFDGSVNPLWHRGIEPAIHQAGYQPLRIDQKEHVNRIDDEIFADIRRSRFVVADFTHGKSGVRGGVYFEAGFAQGLGLPVIWTCRSDMLSEAKLHFDIRQYNFLEWSDDTLDDFSDRLQKRIEAILGRGAWKPE